MLAKIYLMNAKVPLLSRSNFNLESCTKSRTAKIETSSGEITIGGVVKGAGMIEPNMATMLAFITTDAIVSSNTLSENLKIAVNQSFNRITIDGDMSTNDTVLMLANGASGIDIINESKIVQQRFSEAINAICACPGKKMCDRWRKGD